MSERRPALVADRGEAPAPAFDVLPVNGATAIGPFLRALIREPAFREVRVHAQLAAALRPGRIAQ